jgi:phosphinothricin acetyltransferase
MTSPVAGDGILWHAVTLRIDAMTAAEWPDVRRIYEEGLATGVGSFETTVPSWHEWDAARLPHSRLVARRGDAIVGWVALSPVSKRACYAGVAELAVYVAQRERGRGVGRALIDALVASAESHGIWTLQAATIATNAASLALLARCGFRTVGRRERIAKRDGRWQDSILTERRSERVGMD